MRLCAAFLLIVLAGCGTDGGTKFTGEVPTAEETYGGCAFCHRELAVKMTAAGGHSDLNLKCEFCHEDLRLGEAGEGHRSVPACVECHARQATHHDPERGEAGECTVCHAPHGSSNLLLVRQEIVVPSGELWTVKFNQLRGVGDGALASGATPATGICEVCHSATSFFRSDGSGEAHFTLPCFTCHPHGSGFAPR